MSQKFYSEVKLEALNNATVDTDRFLVGDSGTIKYRTGAEVLSDIGAAPASGGGNYIQNQFAAAQSANMWISGNGLFGIAKIGNWASNANYARFGHSSYDVATNFGYLQSSDGQNYINGTNNYISSANVNIFETAGLERMRITTAGNVGIGTTSPGYALEVSGGSSIYPVAFRNNQATALIGGYAGAVYFQTANSANNAVADMFLAGYSGLDIPLLSLISTTTYIKGNVGIGTTSPNAALDIIKTSNAAGLNVQQNGNIGEAAAYIYGQYYGLSLGVNSTTSSYYAFSIRSGVSTATPGFTGGNSLFYVGADGNVGIGDAAPSDKLVVDGRTRINGANALAFGNSAGGYAQIAVSGATTGNLVFSTYDGVSLGERMRISLAGNVGIGTSSPSYKLDVQGNPSLITINTNGAVLAGSQFISGTGAFASASSGTDVTINSGGTRLMTMQGTTGNVGIGTTAPSSKLHISNGVSSNTQFILGPATAAGNYAFLNWNNNSGSEELKLYTDAGFISFYANIAERMRIASTGAIKFNNYGSGTFTGTRAYDLSVDASGNIIEVPVGAGTITGSGTTNYVPKFTGASSIGNSELITDGSGNLAVAQGNAPTQALNIYRVGSTQTVMAAGNSNTGLNGTYFGVDTNGNGIINTTGGFANIFSTNGSERMRITSSGNVGIGTSSPAYKLEVVGGDIALQYDRYLRSGGGGDWNLIRLYNGGTGDIEITMFNTNWYLRHNANATFAGRVGIGTTTPTQKLDVVGGGKFSSSVQVGDDSTTASAANVGATRYRSDSNNSYMDMVMQTGASTYAWVNVVQNNW